MQLAKITTGNHFHHAINVRIGTFRIIMVILLSSWIFVLTVMHSSVCIENQSASNGSQETKTLSQPFPKASTTFSSSRRLMRSSGPQSTVTSNVSVDYSSKDTNPKQAAASTEKSRFKKNVTLLAAALPKTSTKAAELKKAPTESSKISTTLPPPVPSFLIDDLYRKEQERIDAKPPEERCAAFGVSPIPNAKLNRRRLFFGSMLADENLDVLTIHAMEAHGIYHAVAFVESNTTHSGAARTMRFHNATKEEMWIRHSNMFGNETKVLVEYWLEDMPGLKGMDREVEQRQPIVTMWKRAGMTRDDVAVMADVDEIPSRNFLRALQECDFPELQRQELPSCQKPKMLLSTLVFESSPHCISKRGWYHPDVILGQCIEGIGDPTERVVPLRNFQRLYGERVSQYGFYDPNDYPKHVKDSGLFPLFSSRDIRGVAGSANGGVTEYINVDTSNILLSSVAYHLHNWFNDLQVLRNKYNTYGHFEDQADAPSKKLSEINREIDMVVRCARNLGNDNAETEYYEQHNLLSSDGHYHRPIYFLNETYTKDRHERIKEMVRLDEEEYGSAYDTAYEAGTLSAKHGNLATTTNSYKKVGSFLDQIPSAASKATPPAVKPKKPSRLSPQMFKVAH